MKTNDIAVIMARFFNQYLEANHRIYNCVMCLELFKRQLDGKFKGSHHIGCEAITEKNTEKNEDVKN